MPKLNDWKTSPASRRRYMFARKAVSYPWAAPTLMELQPDNSSKRKPASRVADRSDISAARRRNLHIEFSIPAKMKADFGSKRHTVFPNRGRLSQWTNHR